MSTPPPPSPLRESMVIRLRPCTNRVPLPTPRRRAVHAWSANTQRAPSRSCRDARANNHKTTSVHEMSTPPPQRPLLPVHTPRLRNATVKNRRTFPPTEPPQDNWRAQMEGIRSMRKSRDAAVDFAGAGALKESSSGSDDDVRFQASREHALEVSQ